MTRARIILPIVLLAVALVLGLIQLLQLRYEAGDVYPPYSTLRADPLGSKAFFESLQSHVDARRHFRPLPRLPSGRNSALFYLGANPQNLRFSKDEIQALERFLAEGGRVIVTLLPSYQPPRRNRFLAESGDTVPDDGKSALAEHWGAELTYVTLEKEENGPYLPERAARQSAADLPATLTVRTALGFTNLAPAWVTHFARGSQLPVMIERPVGDGSLVLSADSFFLSNEALLRDRQSGLLSWLIGPARTVVFEETHLGVLSNPGVATLVRQYRLHGFLAAALILAGLFVWKNAISFLPPYETQAWHQHQQWVAGRDAAQGFVQLLHRHISSRELMRVCLEQWIAHSAAKPAVTSAFLPEMQARIDRENAKPPSQRDPVQLYQDFAKLLSRKIGPATESSRAIDSKISPPTDSSL